jgi:hypothetical protein
MANNKSVLLILLGAVAAVAAVDLFFTISYNFTYLKLRRQQPIVMEVSARRNQMGTWAQVLAADLVEYSKKNPAIDPLLQSFNIKPGPGNPAAAKPAKP